MEHFSELLGDGREVGMVLEERESDEEVEEKIAEKEIRRAKVGLKRAREKC